jgi:hypothetical protein
MKVVSLKVILSFKSPLPATVQDAFAQPPHLDKKDKKRGQVMYLTERTATGSMKLRWSAQGRFYQGCKGAIYCEK